MKSTTDQINDAIDKRMMRNLAALNKTVDGYRKPKRASGWPVIAYLVFALAALLLMILMTPARSADRDVRGDFRHDGDHGPPRPHNCPPTYLGAGVWGPGNCQGGGGGGYWPRPPYYGPNWNDYRPQPYIVQPYPQPYPQPYVAPIVPYGGRYWRGQWYPQIVGSPCWAWTGSGWGWNEATCPGN